VTGRLRDITGSHMQSQRRARASGRTLHCVPLVECPRGHQYGPRVAARVGRRRVCPYCLNQRAWPSFPRQTGRPMNLIDIEYINDYLRDGRRCGRISVNDALRLHRRLTDPSRGRRGRPQELEGMLETQEFFWALGRELAVLLQQVTVRRYRPETAKAMVRREIRTYFDAGRVSDSQITEVADAAVGTSHLRRR
jgi:hypothetical protein